MKKIEIKSFSVIDKEAKTQIISLCDNILKCIKGKKVVAITSCKNNEGKTFVSMQVSKELASRKKKVLCVMSDFRKVVGHGKDTFKGLLEVLRGETNLLQSIYTTDIQNMDILFAGIEINDKDNNFSISNTKRVLETLKEKYDYIIVDTPTIGMTLGDDIIYGCCEATILILKKNNDSRRLVNRVIKLIEERGSVILGIVINEWNEKKKIKKKVKKK